MSYYALARFIDSSEIKPPDKCMLYRFKSITDRNCWVENGEYRLAIGLDDVRRLFPALRCKQWSTRWCDMEVKLRKVKNGYRMAWMAKAAYLIVDGEIGTCNFEAIPDKDTESVDFKNRFRKQINLYKYM